MASTLESAINLGVFVRATEAPKTRYNEIYKENCDRIYSLAFWMTDNELAAEELSANTFLRAFAVAKQPARDQIDRAFLAEIREIAAVGVLTLNSNISSPSASIQGNIKRVHLERAVVQLPATERLIFLMHDVEGYQHERIARLLGVSEEESKSGLHEARLQIRNLIATM
jgi:RNA polymerase sigma-70 factor, ECF subfamily